MTTKAKRRRSGKRRLLDGLEADAVAAKRHYFKRMLKDIPPASREGVINELMRVLEDVVEGDAYRALVRGEAALALGVPKGSGLVPREQAFSSELRKLISDAVSKQLSRPSRYVTGKTLLELLNERFGMRPGDFAELLDDLPRQPRGAGRESRQGTQSQASGKVFEGRLLENNPTTRKAELDAAEAEIRELTGDKNFTLREFSLTPHPMDPKARKMFGVLEDIGSYRAHPDGIWIFRRGGITDAEGEFTDGLTMVVDLRDKNKTVIRYVGLREAKLESVVQKLGKQIPRDFERIFGEIKVGERALATDDASPSKHIVVTLLTQKKKLSGSKRKAAQDAFNEVTGTHRDFVEIVATEDARVAKEITAHTLELAGGKYVDLLKKK